MEEETFRRVSSVEGTRGKEFPRPGKVQKAEIVTEGAECGCRGQVRPAVGLDRVMLGDSSQI